MKNIIKKILREDEWDWVREDIHITFDSGHIPNEGDILICLPGYSNDSEGYDEKSDPNCAGSGYASGRIIVVGSTDVYSNYPKEKEVVVWPDEEESEKYWYGDNTCMDCGIYGGYLTYYNGKLNESEIGELDWIKEIPAGIQLEPNTVYYFEPELRWEDEVERFATSILNSDWIKNWLLTTKNRNNNGIRYFVTGKNVDSRVVGWCTVSNPYTIGGYSNRRFVDTRKEFNL